MTEVEIDLFWYPVEDSITTLRLRDNEDIGSPLCERCEQFHPSLEKAPVRTLYVTGPQPQPILCPDCTEEWNEYWDDMWDEYRSSQGV